MRGIHPPARAAGAGFTLVEVLIVVAIFGLLSAIAIPVYGHIMDRSHRSAFATDARIVHDAFLAYYADKGSFPPEFSPPESAFDRETMAPLTDEGYLGPGTARSFLKKQFRGRILFYWAPDFDGTDSDFVMILRPAVAPDAIVGIFSTNSFIFGDVGGGQLDGVYFLQDSRWVRVDEVEP